MSRSRHTEAQIIAALKQVEAGCMTDDVAREQGVGKHTILCLEGEVRRHGSGRGRRGLRDGNGRLKKLVVELSLD